jgi:hypothetical protein
MRVSDEEDMRWVKEGVAWAGLRASGCSDAGRWRHPQHRTARTRPQSNSRNRKKPRSLSGTRLAFAVRERRIRGVHIDAPIGVNGSLSPRAAQVTGGWPLRPQGSAIGCATACAALDPGASAAPVGHAGAGARRAAPVVPVARRTLGPTRETEFVWFVRIGSRARFRSGGGSRCRG